MSEKSKLSSKFCTNGGGDVMTGVPKDGGEVLPAGHGLGAAKSGQTCLKRYEPPVDERCR